MFKDLSSKSFLQFWASILFPALYKL